MSNPITIYPLTGANSKSVQDNALNVLRPHLPASLPVYRRLQFGRFFDATCLLSNITLDSDSISNGSETSSSSPPWFIAFVDRSCRPETEVWFFGSWEASNTQTSPDEQGEIGQLVRDLVQQMKALEIPASIHQDILDAQAKDSMQSDSNKDHGGFSRKDYGGHASDPNIMLWGAIHEKTASILQKVGLLSFRFKTSLMPNFTFIWDVDTLRPTRPLPEGLRWGELDSSHFALVRSRTQIPRQDRTLAVLPNLGIFPEDSTEPIAWVFVGLDASLTTLHVEEEWRGKGLAKAITTKLFREKVDMFWEDGVQKLTHGYVIVGNKESEGMCRSLGGKSDWEAYWLRVDLGLL